MSIIRDIPYGETTMTVELPDRAKVPAARVPESATSGRGRPEIDQQAVVRKAIENPLGMPRIRDQVGHNARVTIAFDDPTVTSYGPVRRLAIEAVLDELKDAGVDEQNVALVCANALHRKFTHPELAAIIGSDIVRRFGERLICHDGEDADNLVNLGQTANGYDVELNRLAVESDLLVYVNAALFLGFMGGWKSIAIGLSTWRSIRHTHTPDGMSMSIKENRFHAVLHEMGKLIEQKLRRRPFKFETILVDTMTAAQGFAGGISETRDASMRMMSSVFPPRRSATSEKVDVVIYGVPDWSPYAVFGHTNPILNLISTGLGYMGGYIEAIGKPGCSVIIANPCPERWDMDHHPAYPEVWERVLSQSLEPYEITHRFGDEFATNAHYIDQYRNGVAFHPIHAILATHPLKRLKHASRIFVAGAEDEAVPKHLGFIPTQTVEDAINEAEKIHGTDCSIALATPPGGPPGNQLNPVKEVLS